MRSDDGTIGRWSTWSSSLTAVPQVVRGDAAGDRGHSGDGVGEGASGGVVKTKGFSTTDSQVYDGILTGDLFDLAPPAVARRKELW
jgi:hypothetical protein